MYQKITLLNHRSGVSKTTTALHLGWALADIVEDGTVLLIDADPQCALTRWILAEHFEAYYSRPENSNLKDAVRDVFDCVPMPLEPAECLPVTGNDKLLLLPGNLGLSEYEVALGMANVLSHTLGSLRNLPGAFHDLIDKTARRYKARFVIIDLGPSLSPINHNLFTISDFFIIPLALDFTSRLAVESLASVLPRWVSWAEEARRILAGVTYQLPALTPHFLGYVAQQNAQSDISLLGMIDDAIEKKLVPALREKNMVLPADMYTDLGEPHGRYCLAQPPDTTPLLKAARIAGLPVFALEDAHLTPDERIFDAETHLRALCHDAYYGLAKAVLSLTHVHQPHLSHSRKSAPKKPNKPIPHRSTQAYGL